MRNMNLKSIVRIKKIKYKLSSASLRHENILKQDFSTTNMNQKLETDITYLLTKNQTYYLSIMKKIYTNEF